MAWHAPHPPARGYAVYEPRQIEMNTTKAGSAIVLVLVNIAFVAGWIWA